MNPRILPHIKTVNNMILKKTILKFKFNLQKGDQNQNGKHIDR